MVSLTLRAPRSIFVAMVLTALAIPSVALAQESPFTISFESLVPGVPESSSVTYELAEDAVFRGVTWNEQTGVLGFAELDVEVCAPDGTCGDGSNPDDTVLPAGPLTVTVTATISSETPQDSSGTATGELVFAAADVVIVDEDGVLPFTGAWFLEITAWAAALISIGAVVVAMSRRGATEETVK